MVKDSAEGLNNKAGKDSISDCCLERIMQIGKKKLVLDHLIVQKMDKDDSVGEDLQSILTFGAKALFDDNQESRDIICTIFPIMRIQGERSH